MRMSLLEETMDELGNDHITSPVVAVIDNASNTPSEHSNSNKTTPEPDRMASSPVVASTGAETDSITAIGISSAIIGALMLLGAGTRHHDDMME